MAVNLFAFITETNGVLHVNVSRKYVLCIFLITGNFVKIFEMCTSMCPALWICVGSELF